MKQDTDKMGKKKNLADRAPAGEGSGNALPVRTFRLWMVGLDGVALFLSTWVALPTSVVCFACFPLSIPSLFLLPFQKERSPVK